MSGAIMLGAAAAHVQGAPAGRLDPALAATLGQQREAISGGAAGLLANAPALSAQVPQPVLDAAQKLLDPSKKYIVQNLSQGERTPDADAMTRARTIVFISTSMPHASLRALFAQAAGRRDVAFVLRGWTPPHFRELIAAIRQDMPKGQPEANVFIDPQAFEQYGVSAVPVTLHQRAADRHWYELTGEISIDGAIDEIEHGRAGRVVGNTYPIAEPDILVAIRDRMNRVDWKKQVAHATASAHQAPFDGVTMPAATRTQSHLFDPSITLSHDIINPANGRLLAARGTRINPLELQPFPWTVIAFDPYDPAQLRWATKVVRARPDTLAYVTRNAMHADGRPTWDVLGTRTFTLDEKAAARFDIQSVPTLVHQDGMQMRVSTFAPADLAR